MNIAGDMHLLQFQDMIHSIEEKREPFVNGIEGRKSLEIILGIYESNRNGKQVFLNKEVYSKPRLKEEFQQ